MIECICYIIYVLTEFFFWLEVVSGYDDWHRSRCMRSHFREQSLPPHFMQAIAEKYPQTKHRGRLGYLDAEPCKVK